MVDLNTCLYIIKMHPFILLKTKPKFSIGFSFPLCCNRPLQKTYISFCIGILPKFGPKAMLQHFISHVKLIKKVTMGLWDYDAIPLSYMCILDFTEMGYNYTTCSFYVNYAIDWAKQIQIP